MSLVELDLPGSQLGSLRPRATDPTELLPPAMLHHQSCCNGSMTHLLPGASAAVSPKLARASQSKAGGACLPAPVTQHGEHLPPRASKHKNKSRMQKRLLPRQSEGCPAM